jgi:hypothetical protein
MDILAGLRDADIRLNGSEPLSDYSEVLADAIYNISHHSNIPEWIYRKSAPSKSKTDKVLLTQIHFMNLYYCFIYALYAEIPE